MTEEVKSIKYPEWLVKSLVQFNRYNTLVNEWELVDISVDLQRQPDLPQRLDILFDSLLDGLGADVLLTGNFTILGYVDQTTQYQVYPNFIEFGRMLGTLDDIKEEENAALRANRRLTILEDLEDDEAAVFAFNEARKKLGSVRLPEDSRHIIIQIPYFVKKTIRYSAMDGDLSLKDFKQRFDEKAVLFTEIQTIPITDSKCDPEDTVRKWVTNQRAEYYEQRFIFTLGLSVRNGIEDSIKDTATQEALEYLIGAFLSWAGMGVLDSTRYLMAAVAVKLAHYSHEFLRPFGKVKSYILKNSALVPIQLQELLGELFKNVQMLEIDSSFKSARETASIGSGFDGYEFNQRFREALSRNTNFNINDELKDSTYSLLLEKIEDQKDIPVQIKLANLPPETLKINFESSYFDRIIRNMLRNAAQHSETKAVKVNISFEVDLNTKTLTMFFVHVGSRISRKIRRRLFRVPVEASQDGRGIGLWTLGMAFEAQRLPLPETVQRQDGVCFIFRFPVTKL